MGVDDERPADDPAGDRQRSLLGRAWSKKTADKVTLVINMWLCVVSVLG